ncbi:hypothetical protein [Microbacterium sp. KNMS]
MTRYMRVKNKVTGHEFDLPVESFDDSKYDAVKSDRYPETSRPRRPLPNLSKGGTAARRNASPVDTEKEK